MTNPQPELAAERRKYQDMTPAEGVAGHAVDAMEILAASSGARHESAMHLVAAAHVHAALAQAQATLAEATAIRELAAAIRQHS